MIVMCDWLGVGGQCDIFNVGVGVAVFVGVWHCLGCDSVNAEAVEGSNMSKDCT